MWQRSFTRNMKLLAMSLRSVVNFFGMMSHYLYVTSVCDSIVICPEDRLYLVSSPGLF